MKNYITVETVLPAHPFPFNNKQNPFPLYLVFFFFLVSWSANESGASVVEIKSVAERVVFEAASRL